MNKGERFYKLAKLRENTYNVVDSAKILDVMLTLGSYEQLLDLREHTFSYKERVKILDAIINLGSYEQLLELYNNSISDTDSVKILDAMLKLGSYEQLLEFRENTVNYEDRAKILDAMLEKTKIPKPKVFIPLHKEGNITIDKNILSKKRYDVFIAHASEDKPFATPLAKALTKKGFSVWYDDFVLKLGDSLQKEIDRGLANSRYGIVILSHNFFNKHWPRKELDGLAAKERADKNIILPIWRNITQKEVTSYSPTLAGLKAAPSRKGIIAITKMITDVISI